MRDVYSRKPSVHCPAPAAPPKKPKLKDLARLLRRFRRNGRHSADITGMTESDPERRTFFVNAGHRPEHLRCSPVSRKSVRSNRDPTADWWREALKDGLVGSLRS